MPRIRRRTKGRQGYTHSHRFQLRVRWDYLGDAFGHGADAIPAMRQAWREISDQVMQEHIRERPGTRPWAWWQWSAPEHRNDKESERAQLERLSVLTAEELAYFENGGTEQ